MKNECKKVEDLLGAYIYNAVTPTERAYVDSHISQCPECAEDLLSRQKVLGAFRPREESAEMPKHIQDNFALNVYKKIAQDSLKRQSRQVYLQKFVLQPSFAVIILVFGIAAFFLRFHPGVIMEGGSIPVVEGDNNKADESLQTERVTDQNKQETAVPVEVAERKDKNPGEQKSSQEIPNLIASAPKPDPKSLLPDPRSLLEEANFIHFSLGDRKRALAQYQKLVDNYPNTDTASAAGEMIKSIRESEYRVQNENPSIQAVDLEM